METFHNDGGVSQARLPQAVTSLPVSPGPDKEPEQKCKESTAGLLRILLVEDDPLLIDMYRCFLTDMKLPVDLCQNGHDALEKLSATPYDLVITDIHLPGWDGISLINWVKHHRPATTTVVISGDDSSDTILSAMRGGARDYLVKPFFPPEFKSMIERNLQRQSPVNQEAFTSLIKQLMHDVRGEILNLEITIKLLKRDKNGPFNARVGEALLAVERKLEHLKELTEDYCLLARSLSHGSGDIPTERIEIDSEIITPVLEGMADALQHKGIRVTACRDSSIDGRAYVIGNKLMLKSAFRTLFSNAIRHSPDGGVISYGITSNDRRYKIYVTNQGDVVPQQMQADIFKELYQFQANGPAAGQSRGLGLGLALAKDILRQHGGDVWYESIANGSKFVCTLPPSPYSV